MSASRDGTLQQLPYTRCADDGAAMLSPTPRKRSSAASTTGSISVGVCPTPGTATPAAAASRAAPAAGYRPGSSLSRYLLWSRKSLISTFRLWQAYGIAGACANPVEHAVALLPSACCTSHSRPVQCAAESGASEMPGAHCAG